MGWKRLNIAVDCRDEQEKEQAQILLDELSNVLRLNASEMIANAPMIRKNKDLIGQMFRKISTGGVKGIAGVIPLALQFKK